MKAFKLHITTLQTVPSPPGRVRVVGLFKVPSPSERARVRLFLSFLLAFIFNVRAANLPVSASLSINPPYSIYLNDYTESALKINLSLFVSDLEIENLRVRLKVTIEGQGITIKTKADYLPTPILLNGGSTELLDGQELSGYLATQNLDYQGTGRDQFYANSKLPEGIYRFCIEVVEVNRSAVISNQACATTWLILNDPPMWTIPMQKEVVRAINPQNTLFSWTPRHTGSPNSAFSVSYEVTMVEMWPEGRNPNDAINSQTPFHSFTTSQTQFVMSPSDPAMTAGRSYAVRLKAVDQGGYDLFKNQGYSEVLMFTFGDPCNPPTDAEIKNVGQRSVDVSWTASAKNTAFRIDMREVGTTSPYPISDWYSFNYNVQQATLQRLEPGKKYEYKLYGNCQSLISEPTLSDFFTTNPEVSEDFKCNQQQVLTITGKIPTTFRIPNVGEYLNINGLKTKIAQIKQQGTDMISGIAYIEIPFINGLSIPIEFSNVKLTTSLEALAGAQIKFLKDDFANQLTNKSTELIDQGTGIINQATNGATNELNNAQNQLNNGVNAVQNGVNGVQNQVTNGVNAVQNQVTNGVNAVQNGVSNGVNAVQNQVTNGVNAVQNGVTNGVNAVQNQVTNGVNAVQSGVTNGVNAVQNGVNNGVNAVQNQVTNGVNTVQNGVNNVQNQVTNGVNAVQNTATNGVNAVQNGVNNAQNQVTNGVNGVQNQVTNGTQGQTTTGTQNQSTNGTNGTQNSTQTTKPK